MIPARTRIVCTVGPACADEAVLADLVRAGADVLRINGAHVAPEALAGWTARIRAAAARADGRPAVMVDLPGVKLRTGRLVAGGVDLVAGARVALVAGTAGGTAERVPVDPLPDLSALRPGSEILLDDGRLRLRALRARAREVLAVVEDGGRLEAGKGVAFPGTPLPTAVPTERDAALARAAVDAGADWLALSFVRAAEDLERLSSIVRAVGADVPICAKIERADALADVDAILERADAVIVARGDLGVDVGAERVPAAQRRILAAARRAGCPAIVATEMLESMVHRARPTRAEASDVARAVDEGADAVLLSAETAIGARPVAVVETLERLLLAAEADALAADRAPWGVPSTRPDRPDEHVVRAAVVLAQEARARAIVVFSRTGSSAVRLAKERPRAPIHAFAANEAVCRRLALAWGVRAAPLPTGPGTDAVVARVLAELRARESLAAGDRAVLVMGAGDDPAGATTLVRLLTI